LHQDIKTANILVKDGVFKLADFGFTIPFKGEVVKPDEERCGTISYMSRERLLPKYTPSPCNDLYSIGIVLFIALTRLHPYF
jgi:serine/threonine protein kinase